MESGSPTTVFVLLSFAIGALIFGSHTPVRKPTVHSRSELFRAAAEEAQRASAQASHRARELTARWNAAKEFEHGRELRYRDLDGL